MLYDMRWVRSTLWYGLLPPVDQDGGCQLGIQCSLHIRRQAVSYVDGLPIDESMLFLIRIMAARVPL